MKRTTKQILGAALLALLAANGLAHKGYAGPQDQQQQAKARQQQQKQRVKVAREDILLIMPNQSAEQDSIDEAIKEANGEVIGTIGSGAMKVLLVKSEHGKAEQTEAKLSKDKKNFALVDANTREYAQYTPSNPDPGFAASYHLFKMNVPKAWDAIRTTARLSEMIAVFDSGCDEYGSDLSSGSQGADVTGDLKNEALSIYTKLNFEPLGIKLFDIEGMENKIIHKGNYIATLSYGFTDTHGHGTWVATSAAGQLENGKASAGINPRAAIYPIRIANGAAGTKIFTDDLALVSAMMVMYQTGLRIINISYGGMMNESKHKVLHKFFKDWYERKNGLIFVSAGNDGTVLSDGNASYINVISALAKGKGDGKGNDMSLASFSNSGGCVDFTAPGQFIVCAGPGGGQATVNGTSFSSPICAGVASLIWTVRPNLPNKMVEWVMKASCKNTGGFNSKFGWGMPDAAEAVRIAQSVPGPF